MKKKWWIGGGIVMVLLMFLLVLALYFFGYRLTCKLVGVIYDEKTKQPIEGAEVFIEDWSGKQSIYDENISNDKVKSIGAQGASLTNVTGLYQIYPVIWRNVKQIAVVINGQKPKIVNLSPRLVISTYYPYFEARQDIKVYLETDKSDRIVNRIYGKVFDAVSKKSLANREVIVHLKNIDRTVFTDENGQYDLELEKDTNADQILSVSAGDNYWEEEMSKVYQSERYDPIDVSIHIEKPTPNFEVERDIVLLPKISARVDDLYNALDDAIEFEKYDLLWNMIHPDDRDSIGNIKVLEDYIKKSEEITKDNCRKSDNGYFVEENDLSYINNYVSGVTGKVYECGEDCDYQLAEISLLNDDDIYSNCYYLCQKPVDNRTFLFADKLYLGKKDGVWYVFLDFDIRQQPQFSNDMYKISGQVRDGKTAQLMEGALVNLGFGKDCEKTNWAIRLKTDQDGNYEISNLDRKPKCIMVLYGEENIDDCPDFGGYLEGYSPVVYDLEEVSENSFKKDLYLDHWTIYDLQKGDDLGAFSKRLVLAEIEGNFDLLWEFMHPLDKEVWTDKYEYINTMNERRLNLADEQIYYGYEAVGNTSGLWTTEMYDDKKPIIWKAPGHGKEYSGDEAYFAGIYMVKFDKHSRNTIIYRHFQRLAGSWYFFMEDNKDNLKPITVLKKCASSYY